VIASGSVCAGRVVSCAPGGRAVGAGEVAVERREMWVGRGTEYFVKIRWGSRGSMRGGGAQVAGRNWGMRG